MKSIFIKQFKELFIVPIGWYFIGIFFCINTLSLFYFDWYYNIFNTGYADLNLFFEFVPLISILCIATITMNSISEEKNLGILELLLIQPRSIARLIIGKYLAYLLYSIILLVPTVIYVFVISNFIQNGDTIDYNIIALGYFSLLLLSSIWIGLGIFISSLIDKTSIAFALSSFLGFVIYEKLPVNYKLSTYYNRVNSGWLLVSDIVYMILISLVFIMASIFVIAYKYQDKNIKDLIQSLNFKNKTWIGFITLVFIYIIGLNQKLGFDITNNKRFTLSEYTTNILDQLDAPLQIDILLEGNLTGDFIKLQQETKNLIQRLQSKQSLVYSKIVNPLENLDQDQSKSVLVSLEKSGLYPFQIQHRKAGEIINTTIIPWMVATYKGKSLKIPLFEKELQYKEIDQAVSILEYKIYTHLNRLIKKRDELPKIGILKGNNQLKDRYIASFLELTRNDYQIEPIDINKIEKQAQTNPKEALTYLNSYDCLLNIKPTQKITEVQKQLLDQYVMNGGSLFAFIDQIAIEKDNIFNNSKQETYIQPIDLNLKDMLFSYGCRINTNLIKDHKSAPIVLSSSKAKLKAYPWCYSSLVDGNENHLISKNLRDIKLNFPSDIEILGINNKREVKKSVLLKTSSYAVTQKIPRLLNYRATSQELLNLQREDLKENKSYHTAVLLEGKLKSTYMARIKPLENLPHLDYGNKNSKVIIVSDGDLIKNEIINRKNTSLSYNSFTANHYDNAKFITNSLHYLTNHKELISLNQKSIKLAKLKTASIEVYHRTIYWLISSIGIFLSISYILYHKLRKQKAAIK